MAQVLVRGVEDEVLDRLRRRADGNHRSLEGELREILVMASRQVGVDEARELADRLRVRLEGRTHGDSTDLSREDRDR